MWLFVLVEHKGVLVTGSPAHSWPTASMSRMYRDYSLLLWASLWEGRTRKDWWGWQIHCSTGVASFALLLGIVLHTGSLAKHPQGF